MMKWKINILILLKYPLRLRSTFRKQTVLISIAQITNAHHTSLRPVHRLTVVSFGKHQRRLLYDNLQLLVSSTWRGYRQCAQRSIYEKLLKFVFNSMVGFAWLSADLEAA